MTKITEADVLGKLAFYSFCKEHKNGIREILYLHLTAITYRALASLT